jgi:hypothetical protein
LSLPKVEHVGISSVRHYKDKRSSLFRRSISDETEQSYDVETSFEGDVGGPGSLERPVVNVIKHFFFITINEAK